MVTHQLQVRCRPVKVRRSETDVLPCTELHHWQQFTTLDVCSVMSCCCVPVNSSDGLSCINLSDWSEQGRSLPDVDRRCDAFCRRTRRYRWWVKRRGRWWGCRKLRRRCLASTHAVMNRRPVTCISNGKVKMPCSEWSLSAGCSFHFPRRWSTYWSQYDLWLTYG